MNDSRCPRCGAPWQPRHPDPLERCTWCGALLASGQWPDEARQAKVHVAPHEVRSATARALSRLGHRWLPGTPQLIYYPFALTGIPREPYRPLAALPPALRDGWRPSGAAALALDQGAARGDHELAAVRVPVSAPLPQSGGLVQYPFYRIPLQATGQDSAAWCDATTGQVMLPDGLSLPRVTSDPREERSLFGWVTVGLVGALACSLTLPFAWAALGCSVLATGLWWKASSR